MKKVTNYGLAAAAFVMLQPVAPALAESPYDYIEEVVTTGTRAKARTVQDSPAPVDVISGADFVNQGDNNLSNLIRNVVPSYNVNTQPISDAATIVRPATLRGLAPDHTLVLVNGKRRHRASVISWLGNGIANGAQGPDISAIPAIALKQVEVLRDGAAAQYGSDAIAGVMNFILRDEAEGASFQVKLGAFAEGDGEVYTITGNLGLPVTDNGFANISFEYGETDPTDRSVQRHDAAGLIATGNTAVQNPAQIWGSPEIRDEFKLWGNFGLDLDGTSSFYAHGNYVQKEVEGGFYFRNPNTRGAVYSTDGGATLLVADLLDAQDGVLDGTANCPVVTITNNVPDPVALGRVFADGNCFTFQEILPGGFTPRFGGDVSDAALLVGVNGEMENGIRWDVSVGAGRNEVDFFINNTVNASLGAQTPLEFDPGAYIQTEQMFNADFGYTPTDNTNLAFGYEYRIEEFEIRVGQAESFEIGPLAPQGFSAASNGFPGFSNIAGGQFDRKNQALYVDGEWEPMDKLLLGAAIRYEDFDDFGDTTNYKVAANWRVAENFGLRATASTGFKAPTPGQSNAFNVSTEFDPVLNDLVNNGTVPSTTAVAALRGGQALEAEESTNVTLGAFFNLGDLEVTVDYFNIEVEDRLNLSANFSLTAAEITALEAAGVTSAGNLQNFRFFTNDFDTETDGFDIVATYPVEWNRGTTKFSLAYNKTETDVTDTGVTVDAARVRQIEEGLPETRYNLAGTHFMGDWRFLVRLSYFGDWYDSEDGNTYDGEHLVDAEVAYRMNNVTVTVGAQNLFDEVPEENPGAAAGVGNRYSQFSPFGFNGAFYYLRVGYDLNRD